MAYQYGRQLKKFVFLGLTGAMISLGGCGEKNVLGDIPRMEHDLNFVLDGIGIKSQAFDIKVSKPEVVLRGIGLTGSATIALANDRVRTAAANNGYDRVSAVRLEGGMPIVNYCHHTMPNVYITWAIMDNDNAKLYISSHAFTNLYASCSSAYSNPHK